MIYARIIVIWTAQAHQTFNFTNIVDSDVSFYDDIFFSRPGYADFTLTFAYDPIPKNVYPNDPVSNFSKWWHSINKNHVPKIFIEFYDGTNAEAIAKGYLFNWDEDREEREVVFTCIDGLKDILDEQVNINAVTKISDEINPVKQPTGPGNPPEDGLPPIIPPGLPSISYQTELNKFFWETIDDWWNSIRGDAPAFIEPPYFPPFINRYSIMNIFSHPINQRLQQLSSGTFRVQLILRRLRNLEKKEVLSDLSKYTQTKIVCQNGIRFLSGMTPVNINGFVQSVNSNSTATDFEQDRLIESIILQRKLSNNSWQNFAVYTNDIRGTRDRWLQSQTRPRTEYNIWGYANSNTHVPAGVLQAGYLIKLNNETFKIKDISYESETMHTLKSFVAVCIKP